MTWSAIAGKIYRMQFKNRLEDAVWQDISPDVTATGPTASASHTPGGSQGYTASLRWSDRGGNER